MCSTTACFTTPLLESIDVSVDAAQGIRGRGPCRYGNASYEPRGVTSIRDCKQQMITLFQQELGCANVVFTDDDRGNFPQSGGEAAIRKLGCFSLQAGVFDFFDCFVFVDGQLCAVDRASHELFYLQWDGAHRVWYWQVTTRASAPSNTYSQPCDTFPLNSVW